MAADDLLQQYARDFNCLADPDRKTRQRALQKLGALARSPPPELDGVWEQALRAPLLKLFSDTVEKNRELSITLVTDLVPSLGAAALGGSLPYMVPVFVARLASKPVAEDGEELRLALLQLLQLLLQRAGGEPMAPHLPELVQVLVAGFADPFPDAKKAACALDAISLLKMCAKYTLEAFEGSPNTWEPPLCMRKEKGTKTKITLVFNILPQDKSKSSDYGLWFRNGLGLETCSHH